MNYRFGRAANAAEKKERRSSAALALAVGLALLLPGAAALATPGTPIQGIPIGLEGDPGSIKVSTTTDEHGAFNFGKLPAGKYKLTLPSLPSQSFTVANGIVGGTVMRRSDGSITVRKAGDKPVDYVFRLAPSPTNSIGGTYTTGDFTKPQMRAYHPTAAAENNGDGKSAAAEPCCPFIKPPVTPRNVGDGKLPGETRGRVINNSETETATVDVTNGIGGQGGGRFTFKPTSRGADSATVETSNRDHIDQDAQTDVRKKTAVQSDGPGDARIRVSADVSTLRGTAPRPDGGDVKPGIAEANSALGQVSTTRGTAPRTGGGDERDAKLSGIINNSERDTATVETSNRDHIDQDAQTDIKKKTAVQSDGPGDARIRVSADVSTLRGTAPGTDVGDGKLPGLAGKPVAGIGVNLGKLGGGIMATINSSGAIIAAETMVSSRTDSQGNFHFDKLPAGNYVITLAGLPSQSLTVGADGIAGGKVMIGPDGSMSIFDRWGIRTATAPKGGGSKTAEKPVGFGSGNTIGAGPGGMGSGSGMTPPGAGPAMGGAGPAMGGPGSAIGGPGSAMRNR